MDIITIETKLMQGRPPKIDMSAIKGLCIVAGGSIRRWFVGEKQNSDIDIFPTDEKHFEAIKTALALTEKLWENSNTETYRKDGISYQIIKRYHRTPADLLDTFDFCHCQFAWDGQAIYATPNACICARRKHLMVHRFQAGYEMDSLRRAFKYQRQGYTPCWGTLQDIVKQVAPLDEQAIKNQTEISPGGGRRTIRFD